MVTLLELKLYLIALDELYPVVFFFFMVGLGGVLGSFLGCALYRVPRGEKLYAPLHSFCPHCEQRLGVLDLIPMLSYVFCKGRCRYCSEPLSWHYFFVELVCSALGGVSFLLLGGQFALFVLFALFVALTFVAFYGWMQRRLAWKVLLFSIILLVILFYGYR